MLLYCFRGIAGQDLTPEMMAKLGGIAAAHYRSMQHTEIYVAGDYRISTSALKTALMGGLAGGGMTVYDCGVLPSGCIAAWGKHLARPACMVTASHNPPPWNGVQFMEPDSHIWWPELENAAKQALEQPFTWPSWEQYGQISERDGVLEQYIDWVAAIACPERSLKVVVDAGGGAGYPAVRLLLERLGMEVVPLNCEPDGWFRARPSEPRPEYLGALRQAVIEHGADLGVALDGDADRVVSFDDRGRYVLPDYTIELLCRHARQPGPAVINVGVSLRTIAALEELGFEIIPCRWGQTFIAQLIKQHHAVFSAEPDGHFGFPELSLRGDGVTGAALLCSALSKESRPYSEVIDAMPPINIINERIEWDDDFARYADQVQAMMEARYERVLRLHERLVVATDADHKLVARQSPFDSTLRLSAESYSGRSAEEMIADVLAIVGRG